MTEAGGNGSTSDGRSAAVEALRAVLVAYEQYRLHATRHFGINLSESHALSHLLQAGRMPQVELAERLGLTSGGATAMIDRMEHAGLARRVPDPDDRRRRYVEIDPGLAPTIEDSNARLGRVFRGMTTEHLQELIADLTEIAANLSREANAFEPGPG